MPCDNGCVNPEPAKLTGNRGKCKTITRDPLYVPVYVPKCCPTPENLDPRRNEVYCPSPPSRSEPLSHQEYLRRLKANNNVPLSIAKTKQVTVGEGVYQRAIWTSAGDACSLGSDLVLPAVPPARGALYAQDSGLLTEQRGAFAGRGTVSKFDKTNHTAGITTLRKKGMAIAGDDSFMAPAGSTRTLCEVCTLIGTNINPLDCTLCDR